MGSIDLFPDVDRPATLLELLRARICIRVVVDNVPKSLFRCLFSPDA
jgi:hypothetical protein